MDFDFNTLVGLLNIHSHADLLIDGDWHRVERVLSEGVETNYKIGHEYFRTLYEALTYLGVSPYTNLGPVVVDDIKLSIRKLPPKYNYTEGEQPASESGRDNSSGVLEIIKDFVSEISDYLEGTDSEVDSEVSSVIAVSEVLKTLVQISEDLVVSMESGNDQESLSIISDMNTQVDFVKGHLSKTHDIIMNRKK